MRHNNDLLVCNLINKVIQSAFPGLQKFEIREDEIEDYLCNSFNKAKLQGHLSINDLLCIFINPELLA